MYVSVIKEKLQVLICAVWLERKAIRIERKCCLTSEKIAWEHKEFFHFRYKISINLSWTKIRQYLFDIGLFFPFHFQYNNFKVQKSLMNCLYSLCEKNWSSKFDYFFWSMLKKVLWVMFRYELVDCSHCLGIRKPIAAPALQSKCQQSCPYGEGEAIIKI